MATAQEFEQAGFTPAQADALAIAFKRADDANAQRFALLQEAINTGFASLLVAMNRQFGKAYAHLEAVDGRLDGIYVRLDGIYVRLDGIDSHLARIDEHLSAPGQN